MGGAPLGTNEGEGLPVGCELGPLDQDGNDEIDGLPLDGVLLGTDEGEWLPVGCELGPNDKDGREEIDGLPLGALLGEDEPKALSASPRVAPCSFDSVSASNVMTIFTSVNVFEESIYSLTHTFSSYETLQ